MSLIINGTEIPVDGDYIKYGTTNIDKVVYNGVTVWEKQKSINLSSDLAGRFKLLAEVKNPDDHDTDDHEDLVRNIWAKNGSTLISCKGQNLKVWFTWCGDTMRSGKLEAYLRDVNGNRYFLGIIGNHGSDHSIIWDTPEMLDSPRILALPSSGNYYIDWKLWSRGYYDYNAYIWFDVTNVIVE